MNELVKRLRCLKYGHCPDCPMWYSEEVEPNLWRERCAAIDAADAIEELLQKTQQMPRWIPVTERLPEDIDEEVLVCTEDYGVSELGFVTVATYGDSGWLDCWERKTYITAVTHWMPLPQPPKEET